MTQHPYADILRAIADGHGIQFKPEESETWIDRSAANVLRMVQLQTDSPLQFRIKPSTVLINGKDVPAPLSVPPACGTMVWEPTICANGEHWQGLVHQFHLLNSGKLFASSEDCRTHAQALLG